MARERGAGTVLIIEDNDAERAELRQVLEAEGFHIRDYGSARDALAALHADPAAFGVIVFDLVMPGLSGWDFRAAQLGDSRLRTIPAVALTQVTLTTTDHYTLQAHDYLRKPVTATQLVGVVARHHANSSGPSR